MDSLWHELFWGFRKAHSTQYILFELSHIWIKQVDNSGSFSGVAPFIDHFILNLIETYIEPGGNVLLSNVIVFK